MKKFFTLTILLAIIQYTVTAQASYTFTGVYTGKPMYKIQTTRGGLPLGDIYIELFPTMAPLHTRNFDSLVSKKFYDTTAFHRVIPNFMIQGGDPNSRHGNPATWGQGQPGQPMVMAEFSNILKHKRGIISAARVGGLPNSATSQFFINVVTNSQLDGQYSIYGRVTSGMNWADTIVNTPVTSTTTNRPISKIEMFVTRIGSNDSIPATPDLTAPPTGTMGVDTTGFVTLKWKAVPGTFYYHLDVSTDSLFYNDTIRSVDLQTLSYSISKPQAATKYYWRIVCNNGGNTSTSAVWSFTTKYPEYLGLTSNSIQSEKILVYPNPGGGKFMFSNIDKNSELEVFDVTGKLVFKTTIKDNALQVDLEGRNKGMYLYKITNANGTQQGKLILK